jgi:hypothetical protein
MPRVLEWGSGARRLASRPGGAAQTVWNDRSLSLVGREGQRIGAVPGHPRASGPEADAAAASVIRADAEPA